VPTGYPVSGKADEVVATYTINYASGKSKTVPLRNGTEVARGNMICGATRYDPLAVQAQRALTFTKDIAREEYQVLLFTVPAEGELVSSLTCTLKSQQESLLIFAITAESA
jgi:hypothetical protein